MKILWLPVIICKTVFLLTSRFICWSLRKVWLRLTSNTYIIYAVYIPLLLSYGYLLETKQRWFEDDISVGYYNICTVILTLGFVGDVHCAQLTQVAVRASRYIDRFGWIRCLLCVLTVSATSYLLVMMADTATARVHDISRYQLVKRFEDNIHRITEDREHFQTSTVHPVTKGKHDPKIFHKLLRYAMEDVRMKCVHRMPWISSAVPIQEQIIWRHNGVPLTLSDRHSIKVVFREVPEDNSLLDSKLREYGISMYEINSTLTIHLLKKSEFGSYTCHAARFAKNTVRDYIQMMETLNAFGSRSAREAKHAKPQFSQCSNAMEPRVQWKDVYTWVEEFRLVRLSRRQEPIRIAPGAILSITTRYWHLGWKEDISVDYSVNRQSFYNLCPGPFHGCSKFLLLYWFLGDDIGWRFGVPPLHLFSIWKLPAEEFHLIHCLCSQSYGQHTVRYLRKYYNRINRRHELIEIQHPHTLLVIPKEQEMLDLFVNSSASSATNVPPCCAKLKSDGDEQEPCVGFLISEMAAMACDFFHWKELLVICFLCLAVLYAVCKLHLFFRQLGRFIVCLTLEGSMGVLSTADRTFSIQSGPESEPSGASTSYDVFPSYSDAELDASVVNEAVRSLELRGLRVFVRDRDSHPGMPEIRTVSQALENSKRFLIFLSHAYFGDRFRNDFEAAMIFETLCDRSPQANDILLIRLDRCDVPLWLKHFPVLDWTASNLSLEDHIHQLLKWLEPAERKRTFRCALDLLMTFAPATVVAILLLAFSYSSYMF